MVAAQQTQRKKVCNTIYFVLLCVLAIAIPTSNFLMNLGWMLLLLNWLIEADFANKFRDFRTNYLLQAFLVLTALYLLSMFWSSDVHYGFNDLRQKLPLFIIPIIILTSSPLSERRWLWLQFVYVTTVFIVTIIGLVRYLTIPDLPYREIVPYISHIRFALNVCFSIAIVTAAFSRHKSWGSRVLFAILILWFFAFLLLQQSYTGIVVMVAMSIVVAIASRRKGWIITMVVAMCVALGIAGYYVHDYYHLSPLASQPLQSCTLNGNPYTHANDGFIESGNYVSNYICESELRSEWPKHSDYSIDSITATGYPLHGALIRYLNSMSLPKDSLGIAQLNAEDIAAIEQGIANPIYLHQGSLRKFFGVLLYEYETMRHQTAIQDFTMLERFELWKNGWQLILQHPFFGVGIGDVVNVSHERLAQIDSPISGTTKTLHNQYLTFLLTFGFLGTILIACLFIRAWYRRRPLPLINIAFLTIVLVSFINEDTFETLAGIMFVVYWATLLSKQKKCISITH